jgi:SAM-dependent methyltransferase
MGAYQFQQAGWHKESERLAALEDKFDPVTTDVLVRLGVDAGWRCLEIGAGAGSVARWLADRVGATGHVVAVDLETDLLDAAAFPNLEVRQADILNDDVGGGFDLTHARLVVGHFPDKVAALQRMAATLRPGGWLVIEEADFGLCEIDGWASSQTASDAVAATIGPLATYWQDGGYDAYLGRRLVPLLQESGLCDVAGEARVRLGTRAELRLLGLNVERFGDALLDRGAVSQDQIDRFFAVAADPTEWVGAGLHVSAWGRRPTNELNA